MTHVPEEARSWYRKPDIEAAIERLVALERRVAELEAALNKEATSPHTQASVEQDDYTCPICGGDWYKGPCHSSPEMIAAANRKIRELDVENDRLWALANSFKPRADYHREALESAAKMLETKALPWEARNIAQLVRDHKVTP